MRYNYRTTVRLKLVVFCDRIVLQSPRFSSSALLDNPYSSLSLSHHTSKAHNSSALIHTSIILHLTKQNRKSQKITVQAINLHFLKPFPLYYSSSTGPVYDVHTIFTATPFHKCTHPANHSSRKRTLRKILPSSSTRPPNTSNKLHHLFQTAFTQSQAAGSSG